MSQISIYAPVKGPEGYSLFARDLITQLSRQGVHVCLEEFKHWGPWEVELNKESHEVLSTALQNRPYPTGRPIPHLNICLPEQVKAIENRRNFIYTMFESDGIPKSWIPFLEHMDEILVPTEFNRWSFSHNTEIPSDLITALPIGINLERYNPGIESLPMRIKGEGNPLNFPLRFLVVCEVTNRKNFWGAMHLWHQVASGIGPDNTCIILKVGNYSNPTRLHEEIKKQQAELISNGLIREANYNIFMYQPLLSEDLHPRFVRLGTHYLSTSFGEGWDLTAMQAAACGLHIYAPCHSAYQCWLNQSVATLFPIAKKYECNQGGALQRLYHGLNWAALDINASAAMVFSSILDSKLIDMKRLAMQEYIRRFSWESVISQYMEVLFK